MKPSESLVDATSGGIEVVSPGVGYGIAVVKGSVVVTDGAGKLITGVADDIGSLAVRESMALRVAVIVSATLGIASDIPSQIV